MVDTNKSKYYLVAAEMLPEIFIKVVEAKELLETGEVATVAEATSRVGISRSAFYKYRSAISPFRDMKSGHIFTFHILLRDRMGVLSAVLAIFADSGANILTINQNIPMNMVAPVTITVKTDETDSEYITRQLSQIDGVVNAETYSRSIL